MSRFAAAAAAALCLAVPASAGAADDERTQDVIAFNAMPVENPCSGETVWLDGEDTIKSRVTQDGETVRFSVDDRTRATGASQPSGAAYVVDDRYRSDVRMDGPVGTQRFVHVTKLKNRGSVKAPDFVLEIVMRVDLDENGAQFTKENVRTRCK